MRAVKHILLGFCLASATLSGLFCPLSESWSQEVDPAGIFPSVNAVGVPISDTVRVDFTTAIVDTSAMLDPRLFRVFGSLGGTYPLDTGDIRFESDKAYFQNKFHPFKAGETITVVVNPGLVSQATEWSFVAEASRGTGTFENWPPTGTVGWSAGDIADLAGISGVVDLRRVLFTDLDGDQWEDVLVITDRGVFGFRNSHELSGDPLFSRTRIDWVIPDVAPEATFLEDLDLDGDPDFCFTDHENRLHVFRNDIPAGGGLLQMQSIDVGQLGWWDLRDIEAMNINSDGGPRGFVVLAQDQGELLFFENQGSWPNLLSLRDSFRLDKPFATSIGIGRWSGMALTQPEIVLGYRSADAFLSWCVLDPLSPPDLNCAPDIRRSGLDLPSSTRILPIRREGSGPLGPEASDFAVFNIRSEEPPERVGRGSGPEPPAEAATAYSILYIYSNTAGGPLGGGTWSDSVSFDRIRAILSLAVADFDEPLSYPDDMGFVAGGPGGFQVIEDQNRNDFYDLSYPNTPGFVTEISTADLDRRGSVDLGVINRKHLEIPSSDDRVYFFRNRCTTDPDPIASWCPITATDFPFPDPVDVCIGCDTLTVPLAARYDFPVIVTGIQVSPPFEMIGPGIAFPDTLFLGDTLYVDLRLCPDPTTPNPALGLLSVDTPEGTCAADIRADIGYPQVEVSPSSLSFSVTAGCVDTASFSLSALGSPTIIDSIVVPSPFELVGGFGSFPDTLLPGAPQAGEVRFRADRCGTWSDSFRIYYCGGVVQTAMIGTGISPRLLQTTSIVIDSVRAGGMGSATFCALNITGCAQTFSLRLSDPSVFHLEPLPDSLITLGDGEQRCWSIVFDAPSSGCDSVSTYNTTILAEYPGLPGCAENVLSVTGRVGCSELDICDADNGAGVDVFDFGRVAPGSSLDHWFLVTDPGTFETRVSSSAGLVAPFGAFWNPGLPATIPAGSRCSDRDLNDQILNIVFDPDSTGDYRDTLFVYSDAAGSPRPLVVLGESVLPDLQITRFGRSDAEPVRADRPLSFSLSARCFVLDFPSAFTVRVVTDENDTTSLGFPNMRVGQEVTRSGLLTFSSSGRHFAAAEIQVPDGIQENPTANADTFWVEVERELLVWPNPFTPNGDGKNDELYFDVTSMELNSPAVRIFSMGNRLVRTLSSVESIPGRDIRALRWDGTDERGRAMAPGIYLYVFDDQAAGIHKGTVALAR